MPCTHLKQLYELCQLHQIKLSSSELIHLVCPQCGVEEVCPSVLQEEYDRRHAGQVWPPAPLRESESAD